MRFRNILLIGVLGLCSCLDDCMGCEEDDCVEECYSHCESMSPVTSSTAASCITSCSRDICKSDFVVRFDGGFIDANEDASEDAAVDDVGFDYDAGVSDADDSCRMLCQTECPDAEICGPCSCR